MYLVSGGAYVAVVPANLAFRDQEDWDADSIVGQSTRLGEVGPVRRFPRTGSRPATDDDRAAWDCNRAAAGNAPMHAERGQRSPATTEPCSD